MRDWLKENLRDLQNYSINLFRALPPNQVRMLIYGQGRTGSTLLESLLVSTGYFSGGKELLSSDKREIRYPTQYILGESKRVAPKHFVCHVKHYQLTQDNSTPLHVAMRKKSVNVAIFLNTLIESDWKIIYLRRRSLFHHALSTVLAESSGVYHRTKRNLEFSHERITVDTDRFVMWVKWRAHEEKMEQAALANVPHLEVVYEDDLENSSTHQCTVDRILEYASLSPREARTSHGKVVVHRPESIISNYDELISYLIEQGLESVIPGSAPLVEQKTINI